MSIDAKFDALTKSVAELVSTMQENNKLLSSVVNGQKAALEKITGTKATTAPVTSEAEETAPKRRPGRPAKTEKAETSAKTNKAETPTKSDKDAEKEIAFLQQKLEAKAVPYLKALEGSERAEFKSFLSGMSDHFGTKRLLGEDGIRDPEHLKQAIFYVERYRLGHNVDFNAEYDFDGVPDQDTGSDAAGAAEDEDEI